MRKSLSLAAIPFIATWKKLPSFRIGMKKSADSKIIAKQPMKPMLPLLKAFAASTTPSAAPP